jgi:hypothetical protein
MFWRFGSLEENLPVAVPNALNRPCIRSLASSFSRIEVP